MPRRLAGAAACVALLAFLAGCGGSGSTGSTSATTPAASNASSAWASQTQQLCVQKRAALARLGGVHITYGGIARVGLPAVKQSLESYLTRLLAIMRGFEQRQRQLATPPSVAPTIQKAMQIDDQSQAATVRLRSAVANVQTAAQLHAVFSAWTTTLRSLAVRGDAVARKLNLPDCQSSRA